MFHARRIGSMMAFAAALFGAAGCASVDRFATKLDMAAGHLDQPSRPEYEGRLETARRVGSMTAIQFDDGKFFDVVDAPSGLVHGDVVRIYKTGDGLVARLWRAAPTQG